MSADQTQAAAPAAAAAPSNSIPTTQKSWSVTASGEPEKVLKFGDVPVPKPKKGEVLIKVQAAALNPVCVFPVFIVRAAILGRGTDRANTVSILLSH